MGKPNFFVRLLNCCSKKKSNTSDHTPSVVTPIRRRQTEHIPARSVREHGQEVDINPTRNLFPAREEERVESHGVLEHKSLANTLKVETVQVVRQVEMMEHQPLGTDKDKFKYLCPICFRYFTSSPE